MATALFTRWFQLQIFTPGSRMHLANDPSAPGFSPDPAQRLLVDLIRLRRRLTPYAVSTGADQETSPRVARSRSVSRRSADFTRDAVSLGPLSFGPSLQVIPAPPVAADTLPVGLPEGRAWIDFWTGASYAGGQTVRIAAPLAQAPILVRAGTILPLATVDERTGHASYPLEIRVYPGADGAFTLREPVDGGPDTRARIVFEWNDRARTLRIAPGSAGLPPGARRLRIVVVHPGRGTGAECPQRADAEADFKDKPLLLTLPTPSARPNPPQRLVAVAQGGHVRFEWQEPCNGALYRLKRVVPQCGSMEDVASSVGEPHCVLPASALNLPANFIVTAVNSGGESRPSAMIRVEAPALVSADAARRGKNPAASSRLIGSRALRQSGPPFFATAASSPAATAVARANDLAA